MVIKTTPAISSPASQGACSNPIATSSAVAVAAGWLARASSVPSTVSAAAMVALQIRIAGTPAAETGAALHAPVAHSAINPAPTPMRWPTTTQYGCALRRSGVSIISYAVGPRLAKMSGCRVAQPTAATIRISAASAAGATIRSLRCIAPTRTLVRMHSS